MPEHADIGSRLRDVRKRRGLTQKELATAAGLSISLVRKVEQGEKTSMAMETARAVAIALRVTTTALLQERDTDGADPATVDIWAPVRAALHAPPHQVEDDLDRPTARGVRDALEAADPLFADDRFTELAALLPPLLRDADALDSADPQARAVRGRLLQLTGWLLTQTRQFDAAEHALDRALADAGDRLDGAAAVNTQIWLLLRRGRLAEARLLAERWAEDTEPRLSRATADDLSTWGWMSLRVAATAGRDAQPSEAADALRMADAAAAALGREHVPRADWLRTFGPTTVDLKRAEHEAVAGRPDQVLRVAETVRVSDLRPTSNNRNRHLLDVADAHARLRRYGEAVDVLQGIRTSSPQWLAQQRYARSIVGRVVRRRRTLTPEMRELADATGLPL